MFGLCLLQALGNCLEARWWNRPGLGLQGPAHLLIPAPCPCASPLQVLRDHAKKA